MTERERELLAATLTELDASGYDRLTVDAVAARAGASKATLYRRWPSKLELVLAAIAVRYDNAPYQGARPAASLREDLVNHVELLAREIETIGATVGAVLGAAARTPELRRALDEHFFELRRQAMIDILARHRVPSGIDLELAAAIPAALIYSRVLIVGRTLDPGYAERLVDGVMLPLLGQ